MQARLALAPLRASPRVLLQPHRRLLATPPSDLPPTPPPSGAASVRPIVVTNTGPPPPPGSTTLPPLNPSPPSGTTSQFPPPPPPFPPPRPKRRLRRFLIYTTLGVLTFYPLSGWLSTQYEAYRDFFVDTFPGGEVVADYADEHGWESFGYGTVSRKAVEGWMSATGKEKSSAGERVEERRRQVEQGLSASRDKVREEAAKVRSEVGRLVGKAESKAEDLMHKAKETVTGKKEPETVVEKAKATAEDAVEKTKSLAAEAKAKVVEATDKLPFNFSEGVEGIVREAEKALGTAEGKVEDAAHKVDAAIRSAPHGTRVLPDTQRPRELRPETVKPPQETFEGKSLYAGPPLPLGFEPPPGYYLARPKPPPAPEASETLPLLVPKVKEFATSEPIISQLASTIDSLTTSLSAANSPGGAGPSKDATGILSKAQDDLTALSKRLEDVKKAEKERLEKTVGEKTKEFEAMLKGKDEERLKGEQGLKESWEQERKSLVDDWRGELEKELEGQREGIEKRLREEVVSQGIELQRRWLRSIKTQVESERGGRLAKLDHLTTSLKHLERITLDNSAHLDDNVRLHKVWSALRAVQTKTETGDLAFDEELRALKSLSSPNPDQPADNVMLTTLSALESSGIPQTGVKSFASLSSWFTGSVAPRVHSASLVPAPENASVLSHLASLGLSKLMFRPTAGLVEGEDVGSILARAEWCLTEKDLDGAAREVNRLKGWPGKLAGDWLREARRRLEVNQALEVVGAEATLGSLLLV